MVVKHTSDKILLSSSASLIWLMSKKRNAFHYCFVSDFVDNLHIPAELTDVKAIIVIMCPHGIIIISGSARCSAFPYQLRSHAHGIEVAGA
jgi:hypothetical protein